MKVLLLIAVVAVCISVVLGQNLNSYYGKPEPECSSQGGRCILKSQCEPKHRSTSGSCPSQRSQGFVCCHGYPISENRCGKFGGECFEKNYCKRPFLRATDCGPNKECCILVV